MTILTELKIWSMVAAAVAGGLLSSCGSADFGGAATPTDPVAAAIKTRKEFEQYWSQRRAAKAKEDAAAAKPVPVKPVANKTPSESGSSTSVVQLRIEDVPRSSKKAALPVTTWWEYQGDVGSGEHDYHGPSGVEFPKAKAVRGSRKYVISPYHGGYVKVAGVPGGVLVADPKYDLAERKFFMLP